MKKRLKAKSPIMKKIVLIVISLIAVAACNKNQSATTTVTTFPPNAIDTFTLTDNGVTYIDTQSHRNTGASIVLQKTNTKTFLQISASSNTRFPISLNIGNIPGPINGIGIYKISPIDSLFTSGSFIETYSGGEAYTIDSITVNITAAAITTVTGSYQIWLRNVAGSKTVGGTIKSFHATIN